VDNYQIISSGKQRDEFKELCEQARLEGRLATAAQSAKKLMTRLQADPNSVGEVLFHLKHWRLPVRHIVQAPWSVHFAIDEERRLVYLKDISLMDENK
jgi:hypothetical protein